LAATQVGTKNTTSSEMGVHTRNCRTGEPIRPRLGLCGCVFDGGLGLYGKRHIPLGLGRLTRIEQRHQRAFLRFQGDVQIHNVGIVGLPSGSTATSARATTAAGFSTPR
jgi:hypothetical protein